MNAMGSYGGGWSYAAASYESKSATETYSSSSKAERESVSNLAFYGIDAIHLKERDELLPGRLIVIEGTDGVGRSTQDNLLRPWLESSGYAVVDTEMTRSAFVGAGLKHA